MNSTPKRISDTGLKFLTLNSIPPPTAYAVGGSIVTHRRKLQLGDVTKIVLQPFQFLQLIVQALLDASYHPVQLLPSLLQVRKPLPLLLDSLLHLF